MNALTPKYPTTYVDGLRLIHQGKVRDTFEIPDRDDVLLVVASDRISTHNIVHRSEIPLKGYALTALTVFWSRILERHGVITHVIAWGDDIFKEYIPFGVANDLYDLKKRAIVVRKLSMIPYELIYRARMSGSLWKNYYKKGEPNPYDVDLPEGLKLMSLFKEPVFTPTEKSATDDPIQNFRVIEKHPSAYMLTDYAFEIIREYALKLGIEVIDGKFEAGTDSKGKLYLADEFGTMDCCRFVEADEVVIGQEPPWLDKQILRDEAERVWGDGKKVPLVFSPEIIKKTTAIYRGVCNRFGLNI